MSECVVQTFPSSLLKFDPAKPPTRSAARISRCSGAAPAENLVHDLPLAHTAHARREQEVDAQDLCRKADHFLSSLADLILELGDEGSVALVGRSNESIVDAVKYRWAPNRRFVEQQRAVTQQAVSTEGLGGLIDLICVVFRVTAPWSLIAND